MGLAAALFAVATPAVLAEDTNNIAYACNDLGEDVQLIIYVEGKPGTEILRLKESVFSSPDASSLCEKTGGKLANYLQSFPAKEKEYFYLKLTHSNSSYVLCLSQLDSSNNCSKILLTRLSGEQKNSLMDYAEAQSNEPGATHQRGIGRGAFKLSIFSGWQDK